MKMGVSALNLVLFCVCVEAFLFQPQTSHQDEPNQQSLRIILKTLLSLNNHSDVVQEICRAYPTLIIPHPEECQLYYNCSMTYIHVPNLFEQHMMECDYPDLFSEKTSQCENFPEVCCGARNETKDKCFYRQQMAKGHRCYDYDSCVGDPDGFLQIGFFSEKYKICFQERLMQSGSCKLWFELPYQGKCTSRLEIPISEGGLMPSCLGKADGIYRFNHRSALEHMMYYGDYFGIGRVCDAYYTCKSGNITVVKCKNGTVFHNDSGECKPGNSSLPNSCQLYCNPQKITVQTFPVNVAECPYPLQFSETTGRCENFTKVNCGTRKEEKYICDYLLHKRHFRFCTMAYIDNCLRLPNGVHPHPKDSVPFAFIRCFDNRLVEEGKCTIDPVWGTQTYPYNGVCTQRYAIPSSNSPYGRLPDCTGMRTGNYQFKTRPCDAYYHCTGGRATAVKCPDHTYFDVASETCSSNVACYRV